MSKRFQTNTEIEAEQLVAHIQRTARQLSQDAQARHFLFEPRLAGPAEVACLKKVVGLLEAAAAAALDMEAHEVIEIDFDHEEE